MATGGSLGDLFVNIIANNSQYDKAIDGSKKKTDTFETGLTKLSGTVKKLIGAGVLIALAKKVADVGAASISAASDAQETQNKFDVVFSGISDAANDMAIQLAGAYGLSIQGAKDMLAGTGDLLTGLGFTQESAFSLSEQVLTLGADLASFTNYSGGAEGASEALTKALLGEREMLKGLGISINEADLKAEVLRQTEAGLTFETEKQAKANATLTLVMNQSANAMGDFERSQASFANQSKIAKAAVNDLQVEIGRAMLPAATIATSAFGKLTTAVADFIRESNNLQEAETALENGNETADQRVLLLRAESQELKLQLKIKESSYENLQKTQQLAEIDKKVFTEQIQLKKNEIAAIDGVIGSILRSQQAEQDLIDLRAKELATSEELSAAEKLRYDTAVAAVLAQDILIQDVLQSGKSEIDLIDEQIKAITSKALAQGEYYDDQQKAVGLLQAKKEAILDEEKGLINEEKEASKKAYQDSLDKAQAQADAILAIKKDSSDKRLAEEKEYRGKQEQLAEEFLSTVLSIYGSIVEADENRANEEIRIKEETLDKELAINAAALESALDTNDKELESDLNVAKGKLEIKLKELAQTTEAEQELSDFQKELNAISLADSIANTEAKIVDLLATGEIEDTEEARKLQRDLDNDAKLRLLQEQATADELKRIEDVAIATDKAAADAQTLKDEEAAANKILEDNAAAEEKRIKKETALAVWKIEKETYEAKKKLSYSEIAVNTAVGASKAWAQGGAFGAIGAALVIGAGIFQAKVVDSQPAPAKPQLATGAVIAGSQRGVDVTVAEGGNGEIIQGMGSQGASLRQQLANETADVLMSRGAMGGTTVNINSLYPPRQQDLDRLFKDGYPSMIKEQQRRGI